MELPAVVRWPADVERRHQLSALHIPRLLLVAERAPLPHDIEVDEEVVWLPATELDVVMRLRALSSRFERGLRLDGRILRTLRTSVTLSPREAAVLEQLLDGGGRHLTNRELAAALESTTTSCGSRAGREVRDVVHRLRRRIRPLGLDIINAGSPGYRLDLRSEVVLG